MAEGGTETSLGGWDSRWLNEGLYFSLGGPGFRFIRALKGYGPVYGFY